MVDDHSTTLSFIMYPSSELLKIETKMNRFKELLKKSSVAEKEKKL